MAHDRWEPDPADVERRKRELLAAARGEGSGGGTGSMVGVGVQFVITILVCLFIGQWLDRRFGTSPWLMIAGMLLGGALGMWIMVRAGRRHDDGSGAPSRAPSREREGAAGDQAGERRGER